MARDCYAVFKTIYNQAIADGLAVTVATAAAQSGMDSCLAQQSVNIPASQPPFAADGSGPSGVAPADRSAALGLKQK